MAFTPEAWLQVSGGQPPGQMNCRPQEDPAPAPLASPAPAMLRSAGLKLRHPHQLPSPPPHQASTEAAWLLLRQVRTLHFQGHRDY